MLKRLPLSDPGEPDLRSPTRFLLWITRAQWPPVLGGACFGIAWMGAQACIPAVLGAAVEAMVRKDRTALVQWCALLLALGVTQAAAGVLRHRRAVTNFLVAAVRVQQLVAVQASRLGGDLARTVDAGEVANYGANDVERIGRALDVSARLAGAIVAYVVVAVLLCWSAPWLGLIVVLGVPVSLAAVVPIMRPLERRQTLERDRRAEAASLAADTVVGLRVLRGLGGEAVFAERFAGASQLVRAATVRSALAQANLDALQVLLPGALLVAVTWVGTHLVVAGTITPGALVAYYAYAAFLVVPMRTFTEAAAKFTGALVGADRVLGLLRRTPLVVDPPEPVAAPGLGPLVDAATGFRAEPGRFTALVPTDPDEAEALVARLGRYATDGGQATGPDGVTLAGVALGDLSVADVRRLILVVDREPVLVSGTVGEALDPPRPGDRVALEQALWAASATDIVDGLPDGLETELPEPRPHAVGRPAPARRARRRARGRPRGARARRADERGRRAHRGRHRRPAGVGAGGADDRRGDHEPARPRARGHRRLSRRHGDRRREPPPAAAGRRGLPVGRDEGGVRWRVTRSPGASCRWRPGPRRGARCAACSTRTGARSRRSSRSRSSPRPPGSSAPTCSAGWSTRSRRTGRPHTSSSSWASSSSPSSSSRPSRG